MHLPAHIEPAATQIAPSTMPRACPMGRFAGVLVELREIWLYACNGTTAQQFKFHTKIDDDGLSCGGVVQFGGPAHIAIRTSPTIRSIAATIRTCSWSTARTAWAATRCAASRPTPIHLRRRPSRVAVPVTSAVLVVRPACAILVTVHRR
jgi:hypothetical protein